MFINIRYFYSNNGGGADPEKLLKNKEQKVEVVNLAYLQTITEVQKVAINSKKPEIEFAMVVIANPLYVYYITPTERDIIIGTLLANNILI